MNLVAADVLRNVCRACTWAPSRLAAMGRVLGRLGERCLLASIWACFFRESAETERT
jgi:hypothetical protein